jgi:putative transposase
MSRSFTAAELAALGIASRRWIAARALAESWPFELRAGRGGRRRHYLLDSLPEDVRVAIAARQTETPRPELDVPEAHLTIARERLALVVELAATADAGGSVSDRLKELAATSSASARTIRRWYDRVRQLPRTEWLGALCPSWRPHVVHAECHEQAWAFFRDDYLRASKPAYRAVYRRTLEVARAKGWTPVPSIDALKARLEREVPHEVRVLRREGRDALARLYPAQQRERSHLRALEAVNADGHRFDVRVRWDEESVERPVLLAFQDLASGKILGWRIDRTENADLVRLAFGDVVERGVPEHVYLDNGRGFASKWITGGARWRFRFKVRDEDPVGVMQAVGVREIHWTTPYHGQSKPIERAFGDLCESIAKHPLCEGAYTGRSTETKPHNYGSRAVPLEDFLALVGAAIAEHNARTGREGGACRGRSFDAVFAESYAQGPVRRASEAQRRMLLLAAERVRVRQGTGCVHLLGNRYWDPRLAPLQGTDVVLRFDPHRLHDAVHVYRLDGSYLCAAGCQSPVGFDDATAAREHARKRNAFLRAAREAAKAQSELSASELAALHLGARLPERLPAPRVLQPNFRGPQTEEPARTHERERDDELVHELGRVAMSSGRLRARASSE